MVCRRFLIAIKGGDILSDSRSDALKSEIKLHKKDSLYFTGKKRALARRKHRTLRIIVDKKTK